MKVYLVQVYINTGKCWVTNNIWKLKKQAEISELDMKNQGWKTRIKKVPILYVKEN